ncbi:hypothetical protein [Novosphingobium sediminicola]|uniref:Putative membrane-anchored protein n=1 Tax=Novosphingobium sediminicola TaxID=563162 RepID=A0A7W6CFR4_9SPHN|nr:hypothetical protein [Novosphingobium sediminicola]MBB3955696.1 putative membrane-anchored protein [Novosphingobium sediminicola]
MNSLPRINAVYWITLIAASVFGTNTGDYVSDELGIGHLSGLPWLALLLGAILIAERVLRPALPLLFWLAIITVRTAATNIGDAFHDFHLGFAVSLPVVSLAFVLAVAAYRWLGGGVADNGAAKVDWAYWLCMMMAGAWGTIMGDFTSFGLTSPPLFPAMATVWLSGLLALVFIGGGRGRLVGGWYYWLAVGMVRAAGTAAGDALAHALEGPDHSLLPALGISGGVFLLLVLGFYGRRAAGNIVQPPR